MGWLSNVKKQYLITFFYSLMPAYVIERLFWQERGMNVRMVVYVEIIYALTVTVFEIPSGVLADKFGRKRLLAISGALASIEIVLLLFSYNFWHFAGAVFLSGVGSSLSSGSENALLYDSLQTAGKQDDFEKHLGRLSSVDFAGSMIAALSGGVLANLFNFEFNYIVSAVSMFIGFLLTLSLKEPPMLTKPESEIAEVKHAKQAVAVFRQQPLVLLYCLTGAVLGACMIYLDEFWQILCENTGVPILFFGVVGAAATALRIPGNLLAYKLKGKIKYSHILTLIICISIAGYAAVFILQNIYCLIPVLLLFLVAGIIDPLIIGYMHHHTESGIRATVESFSSVGLRVISAAVGLLFGYISTAYSIFAGFLSLSIICSVYLLVFRLGGRKYFHKSRHL